MKLTERCCWNSKLFFNDCVENKDLLRARSPTLEPGLLYTQSLVNCLLQPSEQDGSKNHDYLPTKNGGYRTRHGVNGRETMRKALSGLSTKWRFGIHDERTWMASQAGLDWTVRWGSSENFRWFEYSILQSAWPLRIKRRPQVAHKEYKE